MTISTDTIFALSSGAGRAGVAVFRLSGPRAREVAETLSGRAIPTRQVVYARLRDSHEGREIDSGLVFAFDGPASFTGEDMAELQVHGSLAVIDDLSDVLMAIGARPAEPGEFTRRAFANGKLDLAQAEALADLIDAETTLQKKQALGQLGGRLSGLAESWRGQLIAALAPLEAAIDFPDEDDIPDQIEARSAPVIAALIETLETFAREAEQGRRLRHGVSIVLLGPPNAGKSSLLNWLAGSEAAIVSDTPGTTRDAIEVRLDLGGVPVSVVDTAGLRELTDDQIEQEGIRRARARAASADLRIGLFDGRDTGGLAVLSAEMSADDFLVANKADLFDSLPEVGERQLFSISLKSGAGTGLLLEALTRRVRDLTGQADEPRLTRLRHVHAVSGAIEALSRAVTQTGAMPELAAEDVRMAIRYLDQITGRIDVEEVLGEIFSAFCIGK
ncbi:tRNA uridine-5-carboxymethylaminomethyl(34) synthesis GTPase MnmE [Aquisalinus flavus]|uniref:tRNA modification GTPase MnmE n=1 Tax=Aquisalinus flavus TaxID=1526572 RepID=A0A8J2Y5L8_9PROT|nr:tRNA uridine-5-carboxymethylaminomethyl(34) synthesis GTPase MnmE [Aquisalinus flavus]MBD0425593.1 tRNA uridine-5-carboxymethylaminomethyl(34) synthesis GTPase MnmE [Aquisalinus flavus]UNE48785.1 tRNA uridine-5-carboxymethylaminomethyl(34) synthesis GTPase MnmE [Aquisalinus flavus]GGD14805.1 tRNA modification GTPase MnmE [Aquisalinus flavus]